MSKIINNMHNIFIKAVEAKNILKVKTFLKLKKIDNIAHTKNTSLYDHLIRTSNILKDFEIEGDIILATMCHSMYSTQYFKNILLDNRNELKKVIGKYSESLVYYFSILDRESFIVMDNNFFFTNFISKERIQVTKNIFTDLLSMVIANEIDHIIFSNSVEVGVSLSKYRKFTNLLSQKIGSYILENTPKTLDCLIYEKERLENKNKDTSSDTVRFIAHAGVQIISKQKDKNISIVIDPWLYPSTFINPILKGFPGNNTIDYLIPEPKVSSYELAPDIILLSHFHTHHAPIRELLEFAKIKKIIIVCPSLHPKSLEKFRQDTDRFILDNISFKFTDPDKDTNFDILGIKIKAFNHTQKYHNGYIVETQHSKVMHVVDAAANQDKNRLDLSNVWDKLDNLDPDFLFIGAAGHSTRDISLPKKSIRENATLSAVQAANLTLKVRAKNVGIIGIYNSSIWNGRVEYVRPVGEVEHNMYWAINFLDPNIKFHTLKPNDIFEVSKNYTRKI